MLSTRIATRGPRPGPSEEQTAALFALHDDAFTAAIGATADRLRDLAIPAGYPN